MVSNASDADGIVYGLVVFAAMAWLLNRWMTGIPIQGDAVFFDPPGIMWAVAAMMEVFSEGSTLP